MRRSLAKREMSIQLKLDRKIGSSHQCFYESKPISRREEQLMAKRSPIKQDGNELPLSEEAETKLLEKSNTLTLKEYIDKIRKEKFTMADFPKIIEFINSQDKFKQHYGAIGLRKILSVDNPPIQLVIDAGLIPKLLQLMQNENETRLQVMYLCDSTNFVSIPIG